MRAAGLGLIAIVMMVIGVGCQADVVVDVEVEPDGSGTVAVDVTFDPAATQALGDVASELAVADLAQAGWSVTLPTANPDGSSTIRASKVVASPGDLAGVLDEIAGPDVFDHVSILVEDRFAMRRQRLSFTVDIGDGWELAADQGVVAAHGVPFAEVAGDLTGTDSFDEVVAVTVKARTWATDRATPVETIIDPRAGGSPMSVAAESIDEHPTAVLIRWIAYALASLFALSVVLAVTGWWLQRRADRLRPPTTPAGLTMKIPGQQRAAPPKPDVVAVARKDPAPDPVRLVIIEPLAVLYKQQATPQTYLLEFVRHNGGTATADVILDRMDQLLVGRARTADLWTAAGVDGAATDIDDIFVTMRGLRPEVGAFISDMERRRIPLAAISNDAEVWSERVRDRDRLSAVWPWLASGSVGATKHDAGIFELLHRQTGIAFEHCLFIDTDLAALTTARELGIRTAVFDPDRTIDETSIAHPVVTELRNLVQ